MYHIVSFVSYYWKNTPGFQTPCQGVIGPQKPYAKDQTSAGMTGRLGKTRENLHHLFHCEKTWFMFLSHLLQVDCEGFKWCRIRCRVSVSFTLRYRLLLQDTYAAAKLQTPKFRPFRTVKTHLSDGQKFTWMSHARVVAFGRQESHPPTGLKSAPWSVKDLWCVLARKTSWNLNPYYPCKVTVYPHLIFFSGINIVWESHKIELDPFDYVELQLLWHACFMR